jgi:hypothetical protein
MGMLNNTGGFFKKSALLGIALSQINTKGYKTITLKSTLMSLWNSVAAYNFIF